MRKISPRKITIKLIQAIHPNHFAFHAGKSGALFAKAGTLVTVFEKSASKPKQNLDVNGFSTHVCTSVDYPTGSNIHQFRHWMQPKRSTRLCVK